MKFCKALSNYFYNSKEAVGKHKKLQGVEHIDKVINIDQSPIEEQLRSNPVTYTGVFTYIRDLFAATPEAKCEVTALVDSPSMLRR